MLIRNTAVFREGEREYNNIPVITKAIVFQVSIDGECVDSEGIC